MRDKNPEEKLLDLIRQAQGKLRLKKELRVFIRLSVILIGLIIVVISFFLRDMHTSRYNPSKLSMELEGKKGDILQAPQENTKEMIRTEAEPGKEETLSKKEIAGNLVLLGIVRGDTEQAIIEDKDTERTIFLYTGDAIGEFTVSDIKEHSVILDYKGKKIELNI